MGMLIKDLTELTVYASVIFLLVGAWLTHVFTCLSDGAWGFLIAGAIMFPVAVFHGWGVWLGVW